MRVKECVSCLEDKSKVVVIFESGLSRIFNLEGAEETIANEAFYQELDEQSKVTIGLGLWCCRS